MTIKHTVSIIVSVLCLASAASVAAESLKEVVEFAVHNSPDVGALAAERRANEQQIRQARSGYFPRVDLEAGYGYEKTDNPTTRSRLKGSVGQTREELGLLLDQMIFDGFLTKNEVRRQSARTNSTAYSVLDQAEIDALNATKSYLNLQRRNILVELAEENLDIHRRTNDQVLLRSEQGVGRQADSEQSTARLSRAETNLIAEKGNYQDEVANFIRVVGKPPEELDEPIIPSEAIPDTIDELLDTAFDDHPAILSAKADLEEAFAQRDTAKSPYYPRINLETTFGRDNDINGIPGENVDFSVMLKMRYNLLNGYKDQARLSETEQAIAQAQNILDSVIRQVEQSARFSWDAYETASKQLQFFEKNRDATIKTHDAYKQQFKLGQRTLLDLLDSANEMYVSKSDYTNAKYDRIYAMYRILTVMGMINSYLQIDLPEESAQLTNQ